jgi:uroporphyrinogen-III decarboxylase
MIDAIFNYFYQMDQSKLYHERFSRYITALRNEKPDMIPIRPFVAEFVAKYAGFSCQDVVHDYNKAFEATRKCASDFDWDAVPGNMVYVWTGLTQALGLEYVGIPGIDFGPDVGFQYKEPDEDKAYMKADEYDELIDDPTAFLYNTWLPRVSKNISPIGEASTFENNLSLVKGSMAMLNYFKAFGTQNDLLKNQCGTVSAISGIYKAPFDIIGDKLRGYLGLTMDMMTQPQKVLKACEALMPHLYNIAKSSADPNKQVPIGYWMHRGCIPFVSEGEFESHYWPTTKPIIEELWKDGHQTMFYAEGDWAHHLNSFTELPDKSILYHVDKGDIFNVHNKLGDKFCLSGGIPNTLLSYGTKDELLKHCKKVIDEVAKDGGYIMDASAIIQNDATIENMKNLTNFTREYGVYSSGSSKLVELNEPLVPNSSFANNFGMKEQLDSTKNLGVCTSWDKKRGSLGEISGNEALIKNIWDDIEGFGNMFIWQCLLSF